ncbi:hypothetical protein BJV82DRAFT_621808 [Fennellomyces sp. T-0311]|nr:hypothetical protein BJV82DRAFT_621808 [Fennellomyces sp. T-0311]
MLDITDDIREQELCTRYFNAAFLSLFDDPQSDIYFRWTGTQDANKANNGRPDVMISWARGVTFAGQIGYAEVKRIKERTNSYSLSKDLLRLGDFAKGSIESGSAEVYLSIQAVGTSSNIVDRGSLSTRNW